MSTAPVPASRVNVPAVVALSAATLLWGSTFLVTKDALDILSVPTFLAWRFGIAAVILLAASPRRWWHLPPSDRRRAVLIGLFLGGGFLAQTAGLRETSAAVSGFLTGLMVVLTPLIAATLFGETVTRRGWTAVLVATIGLALISLYGWQLTPGALITLIGAAGFALQIASLSHWATRANGYGLTAISVTVAALLCTATGAATGSLSIPERAADWAALLYMAVGATCLGLLLQAWSQSRLSATTAAVLMTLEPVFAGVIAVVIGGEQVSLRIWIGGLLIVSAMFIAELGPRASRDACCPRLEPA